DSTDPNNNGLDGRACGDRAQRLDRTIADFARLSHTHSAEAHLRGKSGRPPRTHSETIPPDRTLAAAIAQTVSTYRTAPHDAPWCRRSVRASMPDGPRTNQPQPV